LNFRAQNYLSWSSTTNYSDPVATIREYLKRERHHTLILERNGFRFVNEKPPIRRFRSCQCDSLVHDITFDA
jgi:hypothetical protein